MNSIEVPEVPCIYLDESGNTGSNLVDQNQPVFTLAGCSFSKEESERLLALLATRSETEAHFKRLKRRKPGQDAVIRLLKDESVNADNVKVNLFDKRFMVITKIVDILVEHFAHLSGLDLYRDGGNIALSNMLYYCMPTFCGADNVDKLCNLFVKMIKVQDQESISGFYGQLQLMVETTPHEDFVGTLNLIQATEGCVHDALSDIDKSALDPSIPALFQQCVDWGKVYPSGFDVIHDDSQTLEKQQEMITKFMDWSKESKTIGYDRRKFDLPLKSKSLTFSASEEHPQIQVADIIASSIAYWVEGVLKGEESDYFFLELSKLDLQRLITNYIWPSQDVDPKALGTEFDGGLHPADHSAEFLAE